MEHLWEIGKELGVLETIYNGVLGIGLHPLKRAGHVRASLF